MRMSERLHHDRMDDETAEADLSDTPAVRVLIS